MRFAVGLICAALAAAACSQEQAAELASGPEAATGSAVPADAIPAFDAAHPPALVETGFDVEGARVNAIVYLADGPGPHPAVILLHGFPGNERNLDLAQALRREGVNVLFFHYRGAWGSGGVFSLSNVIEDVGAATEFLRAKAGEFRTDPARIGLVGHSMGGFAALQGAARDPGIRCVAARAPADVGVMAAGLAASAEARAQFLAGSGAAPMIASESGEATLADLLDNRDAFSLTGLAPRLKDKTVLIISADKDTVVPPLPPLMDVYEAQEGLTFSGVEMSGDHSFSWSRQALADRVIRWSKSCL